jgi:hypothetical protein
LLPRLPPLVAVVVAIALGDLVLLMLHLTCNVPLLRRGLVLVEDCFLWERCLGRNEVGAFQLPQQERTKVKSERIFPRQKENETGRGDKQRTIFYIPALGSMGNIRDGGHE